MSYANLYIVSNTTSVGATKLRVLKHEVGYISQHNQNSISPESGAAALSFTVNAPNKVTGL